MQSTLEILSQYLRNGGYNYTVDTNRISMTMRWNDASPTSFNVYLIPTMDNQQLNNIRILTTVVPGGTFADASTAQRLKILDLFNKVAHNGYFTRGRLYDDGGIELEHYLPANNGMPIEKDVLRVLSAQVQMADSIYPEIMKIKWA